MFKILLFFGAYILLVQGTWYFKEAKVCNPKQNGLFPFTGFKIYRLYRLEGYIPNSLHYLSITHCNHGKADYEKEVQTTSSIDIDWEKPFCMLKPELGTRLHPKPQDNVYNLVQNKNPGSLLKQDMPENVSEAEKTNGSNPYLLEPNDLKSFKSKMIDKGRNINGLLRTGIDLQLEKFISRKHLQYTSKKTVNHVEDIRKSDPHSSLEWESRNLVCYKMARRKKYAKRNILFYVPYTFVGGLFECPIPLDKKKEIFHRFTAGDFLQNFEFRCDNSIAKPILPLIAEDSTKQWIETKISLLNPKLIQRIPYLTTANPLDLRFSSSNTPEMFQDTWASKIDVNEDYLYTDVDLSLISQGLALSADYLHKMFRPMDLSMIFNELTKFMPTSNSIEPPLEINELATEKFKKLSVDQKQNLMLSLSNNRLALRQLHKLQNIWDNLF